MSRPRRIAKLSACRTVSVTVCHPAVPAPLNRVDDGRHRDGDEQARCLGYAGPAAQEREEVEHAEATASWMAAEHLRPFIGHISLRSSLRRSWALYAELMRCREHCPPQRGLLFDDHRVEDVIYQYVKGKRPFRSASSGCASGQVGELRGDGVVQARSDVDE